MRPILMNIFTNHPKNIGESYWEHLWHAGKFAVLMMVAGIACLIHAIFPFLFEQTASNILFKMTEHMVTRMPGDEERVKRLSKCIAQKNND
jgi:hypothetical protein